MNVEEYLTHFTMMREDRDRIQGICDDLFKQGQQKDNKISELQDFIAKQEELQRSGKEHKNVQTTIDYKHWQKKPESSRGSGNLSTQRSMRDGGPAPRG